jgi:hypothetical protein
MTKAIEDAANALAIRTALGVPTNAELADVSDVADAAYVKPANGIPHNDLHTGIRDQLDLADTALQPGAQLTQAAVDDVTAAGVALLVSADAAAQRAAMGAMAATLQAMQAVYDGGTAQQKAGFQASVSGYSTPAEARLTTISNAVARIAGPTMLRKWHAVFSNAIFPRVWRSIRGWETDIQIENLVTPATVTIWVSQARGNDTTGAGTFAAPYAGVKKALTMVTAGTPTNLIIEAGYYNRVTGPNGTTADADLNVYGIGDVIFSNAYEPLTWTAHTTGVFKAPRSAVAGVRDKAVANQYGADTLIQQVTTLAACESTGGTWYTDGTTLYVHRADDALPTNGTATSSTQVFSQLPNGWISTANPRLYTYSGITFEGGVDGTIRVSGSMASTNVRAVFNKCVFAYACSNLANIATTAPNGLSNVGLSWCIAVDCVAHSNQADGFNHHQGPTNLVHSKFVEVNCVSYANGWNNGVDNFNGFTGHAACIGLRVNCIAYGNRGPEFADIDSTVIWNIGCASLGSVAEAVDSQKAGFQALHTATVRCHECYAAGSKYSQYVGSSNAMVWAGGSTGGLSFGPITIE